MVRPWVIVLLLAIVALAYLAYLAWRFIEARFALEFERWKEIHRREISRGAIKGSQAAVTGRVLERVAPYLPGFDYNPRDIRFIGDPVDFVVFDGLSEGHVRRVVFVEIKSGAGALNGNERKVRRAIQEQDVEWVLFRIPDHRTSSPVAGATE
jgi:predicted Holliday junction resolvase-like endonuclease